MKTHCLFYNNGNIALMLWTNKNIQAQSLFFLFFPFINSISIMFFIKMFDLMIYFSKAFLWLMTNDVSMKTYFWVSFSCYWWMIDWELWNLLHSSNWADFIIADNPFILFQGKHKIINLSQYYSSFIYPNNLKCFTQLLTCLYCTSLYVLSWILIALPLYLFIFTEK